MKLAIVVGHNSQDKGAVAVAPISESEFDFNSDIAEHMTELAAGYGVQAKTFLRRARGSYRAEIEEVYRKTDTWGAEGTIELHFNAFNKRVRGTETLCGPSSKSLAMAMAVHRKVTELYERDYLTDRGVKDYRTVARGQLSLIAGKAPSILVEPFFGDNAEEAKLVQQKSKLALAKAYLSGVAAAWSLPAAAPMVAVLDESISLAHWR